MNNRNWTILCWNIRGLNAVDKHDVVRNKIEESGCSIICLQETKMQFVDMQSIRKFAPRWFDKFDFVPSIGASSGIIVIWNGAYFLGVTIDKLPFGITICFTSTFNLSAWKMTTVYGPCHDPECQTWVPMAPHRPGSQPSPIGGPDLPEDPPTCLWTLPDLTCGSEDMKIAWCTRKSSSDKLSML
jgi:hypothetical protein